MRKANQFIWENIGETKTPQNNKLTLIPYTNCNYKNMNLYWQGLIKIRTQIIQPLINAEKSFFENTDLTKKPLIEKNFVQFIQPENKAMLGYLIDNKVLVLINNDMKFLSIF
jgi:hypothetical protein